MSRLVESEELLSCPADAIDETISTVRLSFEVEPDTLIPLLQYTHHTHEIAEYIFDSLLKQDPDTLQWRGNLARSWSEELITAADGRPRHRFLFHLRHNARFHDGHPLNAEDVVFSIWAAANPYINWPLGSSFADIEGCRAIDHFTVEVIYAHPYWMARKHLGELHILPRHIFDPENLVTLFPEDFAHLFRGQSALELPIGSGPYQVTRWQRGHELTLQLTESASEHLAEVPYRIVFHFFSDYTHAVEALFAGQVDMIPRMDWQLCRELRQNAEFAGRFECRPYYTTYFDLVAWNMQSPFFRDRRVRQALAYGALDRQHFLQTHLDNQGILVTGSQYYFGPAYNHEIQPHPYDLAKAKALLEEAGWADRHSDGILENGGSKFRFRLILREGNKLARERAEAMRESLRQLKIEMEIDELPNLAFWLALRNRDYDACSVGWMVEPESDPYQLWHSTQVGASGSNLSCLQDPRVDRLIEQSRSELDDQQRHQLFHQLHALLHQEQPYLFFYCRPSLAIYSPRLKGLISHAQRPGFRIDRWGLDRSA
jgi:peptide/nickel transport system substrate-binding protein